MREKKIKRGPSLQFDEDKEKDIIEEVEKYSSRHKLGELMTILLRIYFDSPLLFNEPDKLRSVVKQMETYGLTPMRHTFFDETRSELKELRAKVDAIYNMAYDDYILAKAGNRLGLEEKSKNTVTAQFLIQKRIKELERNLYGDSWISTYVTDKIQNTEERADEVLEHIIASYGGVISELKSNQSKQEQSGGSNNGNGAGLGQLSNMDITQLVKLITLTQAGIGTGNGGVGAGAMADSSTNAKASSANKVEDEFIDLTERPGSPPETIEKKAPEKPKIDKKKFMRSLGR